MTWTKDRLVWYVDNHKVFSLDDVKKIPQIPLQLVMNMAVGGQFAIGAPDGTMNAAVEMHIDYVTVRQNRTTDALGGWDSARKPAREGSNVPNYVALTIGGLAAALFVVLLAGALFFYKFRQRDRVAPEDMLAVLS